MRINSSRSPLLLYYSLLAAGLLFILFSNPFLKIPYDPWEHLIRIVSLHDGGKCFVFWPGDGRSNCSWHQAWAIIFKILGVNDLFLWAKIIHVVQFFLAAGAILFFSNTAFSILIGDKQKIMTQFLSLFSALCWFIGNGTFSVAFQQAWIMWYSVTYQGLTIPLFWYNTALTLKIFYQDLSATKKLFFIAQIALFSFVIAKTHPMELIYYLIHFLIILFFNFKKIFKLRDKKLFLLYTPIICLSMVFVVTYFVDYKSPLIDMISSNKTLIQKLQSINTFGHNIILNKANRFPDSFTEIALVSLGAAFIFRIFHIFNKTNLISLNINLFHYLLASSVLFFLIPTIPFLAGLGGYLTDASLIYRFFFASPWFLFLPFLLSVMLKRFKPNISLSKVTFINLAVILLTVFASKYLFYNALSQNTSSIIYSLFKNRVGVQYSRNDIQILEGIITEHGQSLDGRPNIYHIRGDLAYLVSGILRKYVYATRLEYISKDSFSDKGYNLVGVEVPEHFPKDQEIFRHFPFDKK